MKPLGRMVWLVGSALVALLLLLHTFLQPQGWRQRSALARDLLTLQSENAAMQAQIARMRSDIDALNHRPSVQEHVIRDELGWVRPGELTINLDRRSVAP